LVFYQSGGTPHLLASFDNFRGGFGYFLEDFFMIKVSMSSARAKSHLRDTITQTFYYHVCVILHKHGDIQSITSP